jgi:hypothetical protein
MLYNKNQMPRYVETAGKITILTALSGVLIFAFIFLLNIGKTELQKVEAQSSGTATTTLTVLNTPPEWVAGLEGQEEFGSSTTTPTNSGDQVSWVGTAIDSNGAPYFMIICEGSATPTPTQSTTTLGTAPPRCSSGVQWAVSTATPSGSRARAATTTNETTFAESNVWYAWACDDDPVSAECSTTFSQGVNATNSSPFNVNRRPVFTAFGNNGPRDPGTTITFLSTSSDLDIVGSDDLLYLIVCETSAYSTTTNSCLGNTVASSSISATTSNATTSRILASIMQDANYPAFPFIYDEHGHEASGGAQGVNVQYTVSNVAPTVAGGTISLNGGNNITLSVPGGETTGFTLSFIVADANSCDAVGGGAADEVTGYVASVFRSGIGTSTCNGSAGSYNANNCYPSGVPLSVWNLACTASSTSCTGATDDTIQFNCSFPLWFIADPTNGTSTETNFFNNVWSAGVAGVDNNNATGSMATSTSGVELISLVAIDLLTELIAYDQLEPGDAMTNLTASTSMLVLGNTGLNQLLGGDSMCGTYSPTNPCPNNASSTASSTIRQDNQRYSTTSNQVFGLGAQLQPTSTPATLQIRIPKPTSTSTPTQGITYWGISVPSTISLAGSYTGQNTFTGAVSSPAFW